eukprot:943723-Pyramimonas_sp.AAC.1
MSANGRPSEPAEADEEGDGPCTPTPWSTPSAPASLIACAAPLARDVRSPGGRGASSSSQPPDIACAAPFFVGGVHSPGGCGASPSAQPP